MKNLPNLLIVSGNGRDSGKTTLVCDIIKKFSSRAVTAIKICPHYHPDDIGLKIIHKEHNFLIAEETSRESGKDSARMLEAGADKVYYLQVLDDHIAEAFSKLRAMLDSKSLIICESGWLRSVVKPGVFLMVNRTEREDFKDNFRKLQSKADIQIAFNGESFNPGPEKIRIRNNYWGLV